MYSCVLKAVEMCRYRFEEMKMPSVSYLIYCIYCSDKLPNFMNRINFFIILNLYIFDFRKLLNPLFLIFSDKKTFQVLLTDHRICPSATRQLLVTSIWIQDIRLYLLIMKCNSTREFFEDPFSKEPVGISIAHCQYCVAYIVHFSTHQWEVMHAKRLDGNGEFSLFRNYLNKSAFKALSIKLFSISVIVNVCVLGTKQLCTLSACYLSFFNAGSVVV